MKRGLARFAKQKVPVPFSQLDEGGNHLLIFLFFSLLEV
jgi:hypothetical protein